MSEHAWIDEFPGAVTVCDTAGVVLEMNAKAAATFAGDGGLALVGKDLRDCHPEGARATLEALLAAPRPNVYTIRKGAVRKIIYQSPWYKDGRFAGIVELSLEIPDVMPEFIRA